MTCSEEAGFVFRRLLHSDLPVIAIDLYNAMVTEGN